MASSSSSSSSSSQQPNSTVITYKDNSKMLILNHNPPIEGPSWEFFLSKCAYQSKNDLDSLICIRIVQNSIGQAEQSYSFLPKEQANYLFLLEDQYKFAYNNPACRISLMFGPTDLTKLIVIYRGTGSSQHDKVCPIIIPRVCSSQYFFSELYSAMNISTREPISVSTDSGSNSKIVKGSKLLDFNGVHFLDVEVISRRNGSAQESSIVTLTYFFGSRTAHFNVSPSIDFSVHKFSALNEFGLKPIEQQNVKFLNSDFAEVKNLLDVKADGFIVILPNGNGKFALIGVLNAELPTPSSLGRTMVFLPQSERGLFVHFAQFLNANNHLVGGVEVSAVNTLTNRSRSRNNNVNTLDDIDMFDEIDIYYVEQTDPLQFDFSVYVLGYDDSFKISFEITETRKKNRR